VNGVHLFVWPAAAAWLLSTGLVAGVGRWALRRKHFDLPTERGLHRRPTPRSGGIGVSVPVCIALGVNAALVPGVRLQAAWIGCLALAISALGFVDDARGLPAKTRLAAQTLFAVLLVLGTGPWERLSWPGVGSWDLGIAAWPLSILLVVWLTNAYNFMDGSDGLAGSQAFVAGLGWSALGVLLEDSLLTAVGATTCGASLAFLRSNWSPASIFMGDVGSTFLGFLFAALTLYAARTHPHVSAGEAGILFIWPFIADSSFTLLRRVWRRENLLAAHRSHLYQRLVLTGLGHATVAWLYIAMAGLGLAAGLALAVASGWLAAAAVAAVIAAAALLWVTVVRREAPAANPAIR
jgi:UDP-N-acetylmuramyl pentapeptide phosphotransferase/UDP-N-acetylglucosamine-1-phosphate transferase